MNLTRLTMLYFFIGFISDLLLNYLSRQSYAPAPIKALEYYFNRKTIINVSILSAINAGLTIVGALFVCMLLSNLFLGFLHPRTLDELWRFIIIAFCVGYAIDFLIYKLQIFGPYLNPYYKLAGAGLWGALAFIFSILSSYVISISTLTLHHIK